MTGVASIFCFFGMCRTDDGADGADTGWTSPSFRFSGTNGIGNCVGDGAVTSGGGDDGIVDQPESIPPSAHTLLFHMLLLWAVWQVY